MFNLNGQRISFSQLTICGMLILVLCVQTLNCFTLPDYLQNSNQDKMDDGAVNLRSTHLVSNTLREMAANLNSIAQIMDGDSSRLNKRAFDLGLSRGLSGAKQINHLRNMASADSPYGPGR